jgi:protein TonB
MSGKESDLKVVYGRVLKLSLLLALCLHLVGFLAKREVALHPFTTGFKPDTVFVFPAKPPVPEEPPPIERPNRQVTPADDDDADAVATIDKDKNLWDRPPPIELPRDDFSENYDEEPVAVKQVEPVYPKMARMAGLEGTVYVAAYIDTLGNVVRVEVAGSAQELLSSAAAEAVSQWHFLPGKVMGKPVAVKVGIPITFRLK